MLVAELYAIAKKSGSKRLYTAQLVINIETALRKEGITEDCLINVRKLWRRVVTEGSLKAACKEAKRDGNVEKFLDEADATIRKMEKQHESDLVADEQSCSGSKEVAAPVDETIDVMKVEEERKLEAAASMLALGNSQSSFAELA